MNRTEAFAEMRKRWGTKARYEIHKDAPTADDRPALTAKVIELRLAAEEIAKQKSKRQAELLAADPEYQRLAAEYLAASKARGEAARLSGKYRYTVGSIDSMGGLSCFFVAGRGDSWREAFAEADKSTKKK
jgi:hypothetical protein